MKAVVAALAIWLALVQMTTGAVFAATGGAGADPDDGLTLSGRYRLQLDGAQATGDALQYYADTVLIPGLRFTQNLSMAAFGPLGQDWQLQANFDSELPPAERFSLALRKAGYELLAGTSRYQSDGPGLLRWQRQLTGLHGTFSKSAGTDWQLSGAWGQPLGVPAHEDLPGKGVTGPYLLNYYQLPVVSDSETVVVDEVPQVRGTDYQIDYELGVLTFREPVLETATIGVDYEYVTESLRRTALLAGSWHSGDFTLSVLSGREQVLEEDPANSLPSEQTGSAQAALPEKQEMYGAGVTWEPLPALRLASSWLMAANEKAGEFSQVPAWQVGGEWTGGSGSAGFDYWVVPAGFQIPGRVSDDTGYSTLSAGYEKHLGGPWYSRLNTLWRMEAAPAGEGAGATLREKAEHVLTYVEDKTLVGFSLGLDGQVGAGGTQHQYTGGMLLTREYGSWEFTAERRGVLARSGTPHPGDFVALTNLAVSTQSTSPVAGTISWRQEKRVQGEGRPFQVSDWRISAAGALSKQTGSTTGTNPKGNWQLVWRNSETLRDGAEPTRTAFVRAQADLPLLGPDMTGTLVWEGQQRQGGGLVSQYYNLKGSAEYHPEKGINWDIFASADRDAGSDRTLADYGGTCRIPLWAGWSYDAGLYQFTDSSTVQGEGKQLVQGFSWRKFNWQLNGTWTQGLLGQPVHDTSDDTEEVSLDELPQGKQWALTVQRQAGATTFLAGGEYNREKAATNWRWQLQGTHQAGRLNVEAEIIYFIRSTDEDRGTGNHSRITASWEFGDSVSASLIARYDARQGFSNGNYAGTAIYGEWTLFF